MSSNASDAQVAADVDGAACPAYWPRLTAAQAAEEWPKVRDWVEQLQRRFPHTLRLPTCWWQHNDLVEILSPLRDHERGSYAASAPPNSALDWHRAFRDVELRIEIWIKRFGCTVPGREHPLGTDDAAWLAFLEADAATRRQGR